MGEHGSAQIKSDEVSDLICVHLKAFLKSAVGCHELVSWSFTFPAISAQV
jgi:hypothetical protein